MAIPAKPRKCRVCRESFQPKRCLQQACSFECEVKLAELAAAKSKAKREKDCRVAEMASRKIIKEKIAKLKPGYLEGKAQDAINAYCRARDHEEGCISCDKGPNWHGQWQAGHLVPRGRSSFLRYDLRNLNKQCSQCNNFESGKVADHERGIVLRYGQERLDYLKSAPRSRRYDDDYLIRMAKIFRKKTRIIKKRKGIV